MLRGVSLAPQQRVVKDPYDLPPELKNSIIGVSAHAVPDYGSTVNTSANVSSPLLASTTTGANSNASPGFFSRLFGRGRRGDASSIARQVPVFDANGNLTTSQTGVNMFRFRSLSFFYFFRSMPWTALITYSILFYLLIVLLITVTYYVWGLTCGAGMNMTMAIYFTVVSLAANGGYLGEDVDTMTDSTHMCYRGRTLIVMVCSYVNIVFVGLVAALVVGKAEYTGKLGHRVVFSDFCTLTTIPGRIGQYRLIFRMANVDNNIPLAHGQLRLFCVTAEPLKEYRYRQKQLHLLKNSAPLKGLTKATWGSTQQLVPGPEASTGSGTRGMPPPLVRQQTLTEALLEGHRGGSGQAQPSGKPGKPHQPLHHSSRPPLHEALAPPRTASGVEKESGPTQPQKKRQQRQRNRRDRKQQLQPSGTAVFSSTTSGLEDSLTATNTAVDPATGASSRRRHSGGGARTQKDGTHGDQLSRTAQSNVSAPPSRTASSHSSKATTPSGGDASSRSSSAHSSSPEASTLRPGARTKSDRLSATRRAAAGADGSGSASAVRRRSSSSDSSAAASDVTNTSMTSKQNSDLYASPLGNGGGSFAAPAKGTTTMGGGTNKRAISPAERAAVAAVAKADHTRTGVQVHGDYDDADDHEVERVHLRVQELRWTCAEETYLDHGSAGQLSLWYPATINHTIDERSPLYSFMQLPFVAASLREGPSTVFGSARSNDSSVKPPGLANASEANHHRFQLVAVFDATEMETGSTITAKHTYTTVDIVAHYKFSDRLVHMQPDSGEVMLDFHYFNALLPVDLVELSTTDSDM